MSSNSLTIDEVTIDGLTMLSTGEPIRADGDCELVPATAASELADPVAVSEPAPSPLLMLDLMDAISAVSQSIANQKIVASAAALVDEARAVHEKAIAHWMVTVNFAEKIHTDVQHILTAINVILKRTVDTTRKKINAATLPDLIEFLDEHAQV